MVHSSETTVPFRPAGLRALLATGALLLAGGAAAAVVRVELFGVAVPRLMSVAFGVAGVLLGGWFVVAVAHRMLSDDPAISFGPDRLDLHVTPGRRLHLERNELRLVQGPSPCRGMQRVILGDAVVRLKTTRSEGLMASDVVIGSGYVSEPIEAVAERLRTWSSSSL